MSTVRLRTTQAQKSEGKGANGSATTYKPTEHGREVDKKLDAHHDWEFGGPVGVTAMMLGFPVLMYYLWICLWFYEGKLVHPSSVDDIKPFFQKMITHVVEDAAPTKFATTTYLGLTAIQLLFALVMPGLNQEGLPVPSLNYKTLLYHCNALCSFYTTIVLTVVLHITGLFPTSSLIANFGSLMTVAIITSFIITILIYYLTVFFHYGGAPIRMSGITVYDIFMGASLNPRLFTSKIWSFGRKEWAGVDLKMFAEVRVPWVLLFLISISGAVTQYEDLGYVTPNMLFMILATGLYINACAKAEEMIPQTWDMYHEKFGFMLIFWNMAGVPFTYCYPIIYMARNDPSSYRFPVVVNILLFATLLCSYYVFDTSMAQKSSFKMQQQGVYKPRGSFPTFAYGNIKNPSYIQTKHGNKLLTSGWWAYARKINYTADWIQSCTWGLSAGLNTPITLFYPAFFLAVLTHRCGRDFERCERKYGDDWKRYCEVVKYRFIPGVY